MTAPAASRTRPLALAYIRVSTEDQSEHGASLDAQRAALAAEAQRRGWDVEVVADAGLSGKSLNRPGLQSALARLDRGEADVLLAVRLDRVSRSVADFAGLLDRCQRRGWELVLLSPNIDTADPAGRFTANVLASAAQYERELISQRTREGMAQRKAEGVRFGRPNEIPDEVRERILRLRAEGVRVSHIARALTEEGVPTARGGAVWRSSTIDRVLAQAEQMTAAA
ncbi:MULTISPECIES: recombinase family protein [Micrococcus]|uniref:recombinase family protein n=1 Tax=Micrococcus TaxID=1269 RepID=UPI0005CB9BCE|nr:MULTISPECIES: recombinase family protein [Micrococcus]QTP19085.1 recombinase family protein [Micrococcus luteus]RYD00115.1 recombinase family protein [Micrococcus sp. MS-ASIII-49]